MTRISIQLPSSYRDSARRLAKREGMSLNQFIASAVGEKLSAFAAEDFLHKKAKRGSRAKYDAILKKVKNRRPMKGDTQID